MMAVGGFVICPFHGYQEPVFTQQVKQTVPSDIQRFIGLSIQQIVQFTRTDSWLTAPGTGNKIKNLSMMLLPFLLHLVLYWYHACLLCPRNWHARVTVILGA